jgi:hypothetical protein
MTPHLFAVEVDVFQVEGVNMARQESQYCEKNINQEISTASRDDEHANGW